MSVPAPLPNIWVTGSPGSGKTTLCATLCENLRRLGFHYQHLDVSKAVIDYKLYKRRDEKRDCAIYSERLVRRYLRKLLKKGGCLVDFHSPVTGLLKPKYLHGLLLLRTDNSVLFDRLTARGYPEEKVRENVECEIFNEVGDSFENDMADSPQLAWVLERPNDTLQQQTATIQLIQSKLLARH